MSGPILGIDLGTTNSLAAVKGKAGPAVIRDRQGRALIPSVVSFTPEGPVVGERAKALLLDYPDRTVYSIKRLIGQAGESARAEAARLPYRVELFERDLPRVVVDGHRYSPEEVSAMVLGEVKRSAEAALAQPISKAVITVPAYFDDAQRQATRDAARLAGLDCERIINEPTAASLAYGIDGSRDGTVLVYDLGGGTFDVSVLRIQDGTFRVLATAGDTHLGGDDFDRLLEDRIRAVLPGEATTPYARQAIRRAAEALKVRLSDEATATLEVDLGSGNQARVTVTRAELEASIEPLVEKTLASCRRALQDAEVSTADLDDVVLVGGSTRVPLVRARLVALTGREPRTDVDPDLAVALGAAIQAGVLAGDDRSLLLLDVIPLSLGIETMGGAMSKLILRNATIPTSRTEEFSTQVDDQTGVDVNIYQGEREMVADCRHLGSFKLTGIPPMPAGLPRIAVTFLVDADGVLTVRATEQRTGKEASIQVVPSFGLTREEVDRMMVESIERAREDVAAREAVETRNKARAMVHGTRRALELADLPPDQSYGIEKAADRVAALLEAEAPAADLAGAVQELSRATSQVADDVISTAVRKALGEAP